MGTIDNTENSTTKREVRVMSVKPEFPGSTIWVGVGLDGMQRVEFAGDWRCMRDIHEALFAGENVMVNLEPWQILRETRLN